MHAGRNGKFQFDSKKLLQFRHHVRPLLMEMRDLRLTHAVHDEQRRPLRRTGTGIAIVRQGSHVIENFHSAQFQDALDNLRPPRVRRQHGRPNLCLIAALDAAPNVFPSLNKALEAPQFLAHPDGPPIGPRTLRPDVDHVCPRDYLCPSEVDSLIDIQGTIAGKRIVIHIHNSHHQGPARKLNHPRGQLQLHADVIGRSEHSRNPHPVVFTPCECLKWTQRQTAPLPTQRRLPKTNIIPLARCPTITNLPAMSSTFGQVFRIHTYGESHGGGVGVVIDGCPPRIPLSATQIQCELDRRRPGQSEIVTPRKEADSAEILSGLQDGLTLGSPISILIRNTDQRPGAYDEMAVKYRPSHADYTYDAKYGIRSASGGGRASARETIGRVAAAAVARQVLDQLHPGIEVLAWVKSIQELHANVDPLTVSFDQIESNIVRTGDAAMAETMIERIKTIRNDGNSVGGVIECVIRNCPPGLGAPIFDKLEADLAKAMLSLPATKGFEIGSGFAGTLLTGREHNDPFRMIEGKVRTTSNRSGGIQGGISNGENIVFRVAFKPTATIMTAQETVTNRGENTELKGRGRHDACVLPRAVPIVEAMATLVLTDHLLRQRAIHW
jgi:chorismate synthase